MYNLGGTFNGNVNGYGFLALAILIAGSWKIQFLTLMAVIFAFLTSLFNQLRLSANMDRDVANIIPFAFTLLTMILFSKYNVAPKNIGIPFDKSKR